MYLVLLEFLSWHVSTCPLLKFVFWLMLLLNCLGLKGCDIIIPGQGLISDCWAWNRSVRRRYSLLYIFSLQVLVICLLCRVQWATNTTKQHLNSLVAPKGEPRRSLHVLIQLGLRTLRLDDESIFWSPIGSWNVLTPWSLSTLSLMQFCLVDSRKR